jgi:predicted nuclease of predicted toxin-antitoxin system
MTKFLIDTQLPPKLAMLLQDKGFDAKHTTFFPEGHLLTDLEIVNLAIKEDRVIISKDRDFFDYYVLRGGPPKVLLLQFGNIGNRQLWTLFEQNLSVLLNLFTTGAGLVIFSKDQIFAY